MSPFIGIGFYSLSVMILFVLNYPLTLSRLFLLTGIIWICTYNIFKFQNSNNNSKIFTEIIFNRLFLFKSFVCFSAYFLLVLFCIKGFITDASPDSTQYESVGRFLAQGGTLKDDVSLKPFLINGRLVLVPAMIGIARLFGCYTPYAFYPMLSFWLLITITIILYDLMDNINRSHRLILSLVFFLVLGFYKNFFNYSFDIGSNSVSMVFFSLSILSLLLFLKYEAHQWLYFGSVSVAIGTLARTDMLVFSLIYLFQLYRVCEQDSSSFIKAAFIFVILAFPWRIITFSFIPFVSFWYMTGFQMLQMLFLNIFAILTMIILFKLKI